MLFATAQRSMSLTITSHIYFFIIWLIAINAFTTLIQVITINIFDFCNACFANTSDFIAN